MIYVPVCVCVYFKYILSIYALWQRVLTGRIVLRCPLLLKKEGKFRKIGFGACPYVYSIGFHWPFALYRVKMYLSTLAHFFACGNGILVWWWQMWWCCRQGVQGMVRQASQQVVSRESSQHVVSRDASQVRLDSAAGILPVWLSLF